MFELAAKWHDLVHSWDDHHVWTTQLQDELSARQIFESFDTNGDGIISRDEAIAAAETMQGCSAAGAVQDVDLVFRTYDKKGDGIDYDEFLNVIAGPTPDCIGV